MLQLWVTDGRKPLSGWRAVWSVQARGQVYRADCLSLRVSRAPSDEDDCSVHAGLHGPPSLLGLGTP